MRVLILNTCSILNRGDAAIVLGQINLLQKYYPGVSITITTKTPALDRVLYNPMGVDVVAPFTPALSTYKGFTRKLTGSAQMLVAWKDKKHLINVMRQSDLVLSCGGGYFYSYRRILPGSTFTQNVIHAYLAALLNKPVVFLPQSIGPFSNSLARKEVKYILEGQKVHKIFAREKISYQLLHQMLAPNLSTKIALCPDMAFYLDGNGDQDVYRDRNLDISQPILALNLREWVFPEAGKPDSRRLKRDEYINTFITVARFFVQHYQGRVMVIPQALGPDPVEDDRIISMEFIRRVQEHIPGGETVQFHNPDTSSLTGFLQLLSQAMLLIGTRLHSCILAMLVGVPVISIGYQYKSQGTLNMLGLDRFNKNISDISSEWLITMVEEIMDHRQQIQEEIRRGLNWAHTQIDDQVGGILMSLSNAEK